MKKSVCICLAVLLLLSACAQVADHTTWQEQYDLGIRYLSEGKYEEAVLAFQTAVWIDSKRAEAYIGLADAYIALGDADSALQALREGYAATGDERLQARADELTAPAPTPKPTPTAEPTAGPTPEPTPTPTPEPTPEPSEANPEQSGGNGSISFSGSGRSMSMSLTYPGLPEEVYVAEDDGRTINATFMISFSDGRQTFAVWTQVIDKDGGGYMTAVPDGSACRNILTVPHFDGEDRERYVWTHLNDSVAVSRGGDTLTWSFTLPDAGFQVSDIRYIGYKLSFTSTPEGGRVGERATFAVEDGELTYMNDGMVEDLGFLLTEAEWIEHRALYLG